jgi:hypothetical protein
MSAPKPPPESVLARAAELRAGGSSWEAVAEVVRRAADTVRQWPARYPDRWQAALHAAERRVAGEITAEAVIVLRRLLRSKNERVARDAARALIDLRIGLARLDQQAAPADATSPSLPSDAQQLVTFLEGHTDEELARLAAQLYAPPPLPPVEGEPPAVAGAD